MPRAKNVRPISVAVTPQPGYWVSFVTVGKRPNGKSDRRKVSTAMCDSCKAAASVECACHARQVGKVRALEDQVAAGAVARPGRQPTVMEWFETWLTEIAPYQPSTARREPLREKTIYQYRSTCRTWIYPHLGWTRLDALETADLDRLFGAMYAAGRKSSTVRNAYSILVRGLGLARQRGKIDRNIAKDLDPPGTPTGRRRKALSREQVRELLAVVDKRDDALRWKVGLAIGPRQGEALAIRWQHLDLDEGVVDTSWQVQRHTWRHGCANPAACGPGAGRTWHVVPLVCAGGPVHDLRHRRGCPKPRAKVCKPGCTGHAAKCPTRHGGGLVFTRPKTYRDERDRHLIALPEPIVAELREHRRTQAAARLRAGSQWVDHDLVFCGSLGQPLDPRNDYRWWNAILAQAGLEGAGTHVMRATSATLMLELGVDIAVVQEVLGHRNINITRGYAEVSVGLTRRAAQQMGDVFAPVIDIKTRRATNE